MVSMAYDPMGRLFQTSGGSAGTTQFLYDGDALVADMMAPAICCAAMSMARAWTSR